MPLGSKQADCVRILEPVGQAGGRIPVQCGRFGIMNLYVNSLQGGILSLFIVFLHGLQT